jgi:hypothetical protein
MLAANDKNWHLQNAEKSPPERPRRRCYSLSCFSFFAFLFCSYFLPFDSTVFLHIKEHDTRYLLFCFSEAPFDLMQLLHIKENDTRFLLSLALFDLAKATTCMPTCAFAR